MNEYGLFGSFPLSSYSINEHVRGYGPGAYLLGYISGSNFYVQRVGRSDSDLNSRLHDYVGKYHAFQYVFFETARDAFYKECRLYHEFDPDDNFIHPDKPTGTNYICPVCSQ